MTMPADKPPVSWRVTGSTETTQAGPNQTLVKGNLIEYVTGQNGTGTVFIPKNVTDWAAIRATIQAAAERTDTLNALTSEG